MKRRGRALRRRYGHATDPLAPFTKSARALYEAIGNAKSDVDLKAAYARLNTLARRTNKLSGVGLAAAIRLTDEIGARLRDTRERLDNEREDAEDAELRRRHGYRAISPEEYERLRRGRSR